ncbi:MAG TPA: flagellar basal-body MS-ring/collar protein FliF [Bauldia sp.]|nr:flagellar basal-body MS-ring/collar protein FliF [Bauldia sp.]
MNRETALKLWNNLKALGPRRLTVLALVGVAVLATIAVGTAFLSQPQQEVLYSGLDRDDVGRMGGALRDAGIDFDVSADGSTVLVNYGDTARARMLLAEKGLPQGANTGYDLFNQVGSFGLTSFMQQVTRTRALEGELARTITAMNGVKAARVHLVLPDPGSFRADQQPASASVVIRTVNPSDASEGQAIRLLVAAAVPGLKADNVTVLNTEGAVLASGDDLNGAAINKMAMVEEGVARDVEEKIRRTLSPYVGIGNFEVSVAARINMDRQTTSETIFDPASKVERSVRTVKETGAATNTSNTSGGASVKDALPDERAAPASSGKNTNETNDRREELTNYELSSKTIETTRDGFTIEKLSIAVLVNKDKLAAVAGSGADAVPVEHQLMDLEQLVASASGYSKERGDVLKVASVAFVDNTPETDSGPGIFDTLIGQAGTFVKAIAIILVVVLVVFLGLRPTVKAILAAPAIAPAASPALLEDASASGLPSPAGAPPTFANDPGVNLIEDVTKRLVRSPQKRLEQIVEFDEAQAAAILRQWLQQDEAA